MKLLIAIAGIALVSLLVAFLWGKSGSSSPRRAPKGKAKAGARPSGSEKGQSGPIRKIQPIDGCANPLKEAAPPAEARSSEGSEGEEPSTQDLLPLATICDRVLYQTDGTCVAYVGIECKNNSLLDVHELVAETAKTASCLAGVTYPFKILHIQRPSDPAVNVRHLKGCDDWISRRAERLGDDEAGRRRRKNEVGRRKVLASYRKVARLQSFSSARMMSEVCLVIPETYSTGNDEVVLERAKDLASYIRSRGYRAHVYGDLEIERLLLDYFGVYRSETELQDPGMTNTSFVRGIHDIRLEEENAH